jgi:hypothetical protein
MVQRQQASDGTSSGRPNRFQLVRLEERIAPKILVSQVNGGGNTPNGNANGVPTVATNPAGQLPPGQN